MTTGSDKAKTHLRFHYRSLDELKADIRAMGLDIPFGAADGKALYRQPLDIAGRVLPNRFAVHPMEGFDADPNGTPGPLSFRRYARYAAGGAGLIWFEATAIVPEARSNPGQFWIHSGNVATFTRLVAETRAAARQALGREPVLILQLTHSGRYSKPTGTPAPIIAHHSPVLDPLTKIAPDYPVVTDEYLDALPAKFAAAARLAKQAGFDGVDVKSCHRYLMSELLASFTREGKYGGSFENRTRLLRESLKAVRAAVPELILTTRMNAYDAIPHPYGWGVDAKDHEKPDLTEPLKLIGLLREIGISLLNISIGNPYYLAHYGRPYDFAIAGVKPAAEHPLIAVARFMKVSRAIQAAYPDLPLIGGGYTWLRQFLPEAAAGVLAEKGATLIGIGRQAFAYPECVNDILAQNAMDPAKCCVTCSACTQIMRDGGRTGCVVRDAAIYGPQYRLARRFAVDRLVEEARRCRECEEATCARGCPAHIDIPAFLKAFAEQDIARAYAVLKAKNVLPEVCGGVCPANEQCQGQCVENIFCERPIAIQDIQAVTARLARLKGLTGVKLPAKASGRTVAIVGGGPAGVACAISLLEAGHRVELYDAKKELGGTPDSAIPAERYADSRAEIRAILAPAVDAGRFVFHAESALGVNLTLADLRQRADAVFLACGLRGNGVGLGQAEGVVGAMEFLESVKKGVRTSVPARVAVLGAGNTAMDAASSAARLGARDVYVVYRRSFAEMPAWPEEREAFLKLGGHLLILTQPLGYVTDAAGKLAGVRVCRTELGAPDASGRRKPVAVKDSESVLAADLVVEAMGQGVDLATRTGLDGVELTSAGLVAVKKGTQQTSLPKVFAGGDLVNGGQTAVQAIAEGMKAAAEIAGVLKQ